MSTKRFALLVSEFNPEITSGLELGARHALKEGGVLDADVDVYRAPGAFEMPLLAKALAQTDRYAGVICLGCVIKGDTAHFEFISLGATIGIQQAALDTGIPIAFGVLTTYTPGQALVRSKPSVEDPHNKGREAALACLSSARFLAEIRSRP